MPSGLPLKWPAIKSMIESLSFFPLIISWCNRLNPCRPKRILTNEDLEKMVDTSDEWITTRTGIKTRHIAQAGEETSKLASVAARRALDMAGVTPAEVDMIVVGTI